MEFVVSWARRLLEGIAAAYSSIVYVLNSSFTLPGSYVPVTFWQLMSFVLGAVIVTYIVARIARMLIGD